MSRRRLSLTVSLPDTLVYQLKEATPKGVPVSRLVERLIQGARWDEAVAELEAEA